MSLSPAVWFHPEVQRKAQDEIEAVSGHERFPTFEDSPILPFVDALGKAVFEVETSYIPLCVVPVVPVAKYTHIHPSQMYLTWPGRIACMRGRSCRRVRDIAA